MPLSQLRNVNFGRFKLNATGSTGVGYQLLDTAGSVVTPRTFDGVYQTAPGIYAAYIPFPDEFRGQLLWDTGEAFEETFYAAEQYNVEENNPGTNETQTQVGSLAGSIGTATAGITTLTTNLDALEAQLTVISGNIDSAVASATQAAINAYGTFTKLIQVSGSVEAIAGTVGDLKTQMQDLYDIQFGRWHIVGDHMFFYRSDNVTEIARFSLRDDAGNPTMDAVFERVRI